MKNPAWLGMVVLLAFSCRKSPVADQPAEPVPSPAKPEAVLVRIVAPPAKVVAADDEAVPENPRTRPLPRPEDPKHKPAPPLNQPAPFAVAVKGKPGFVISPFNDKIIDVRDMPPGTLVSDPTYPAEERKFFRVP